MSSPDDPPKVVPLIGNFQGHIQMLQLGFPNTGNGANSLCPENLRAVSWPEGKRIDLTWELPASATFIAIKRSKSFHPYLINDSSDFLYVGKPITHFIDGKLVSQTVGHPDNQQHPATLDAGIFNTGEDLEESTLYYYTVFVTKAVDPIGVIDFGPFARSCMQVTGLSGEDILNSEKPGLFREWLYQKSPGGAVEEDQKLATIQGRKTGYWQDITRFQQGFISLVRNYTTKLQTLKIYDESAPGYVGVATNQINIIAQQVRLFGFPIERFIPDLNILRRLANTAVDLISEKGTCVGIEHFIKVLTLWDAECVVFGQSNCLTSYLKTWDGKVERLDLSYLYSTMTVEAGIIYLPDNALTTGKFDEGVLIDSMGEKYHIKSNTEDVIILENTTAIILKEDLLTIINFAILGGGKYELQLERVNNGPINLNVNEFVGFQIIDSANVVMDVLSTDFTNPNLVTVESPAPPTLGDAATAPFYIQGADFAAREPQVHLTLYSGCPSFVWEPRRNLDLYSAGGDPGPFNPTFAGGLLKGNSLVPGDLVITIKAGVAEKIGTITDLLGDTLWDTGADFGDPNEFINYYINPNRNQKSLFPILVSGDYITANTLFDGSIDLSDVSRIGSNYYILSILNAALYNMLVRSIKLMTPRRYFIFFE